LEFTRQKCPALYIFGSECWIALPDMSSTLRKCVKASLIFGPRMSEGPVGDL
jgi:hypothetical protein